MTNSAPNPNKARDRVADRDRALRALALRRDGKPWYVIADELNYHDPGTAYTAVSRVLARVESESAVEYRQLLTERYESLYAEVVAALGDARAGREVGRAQLVSAGRGVLDSLARLHGLQAADAVTVNMGRARDGIDEELARLASLVRDKAVADAKAAGIDDPELPVLDAIIDGVASLDRGVSRRCRHPTGPPAS